MDSDRNVALLVAIRKADLPSVKLILKTNKIEADEKWMDYTLLVVALQKRRVKIVNLLLDKGCRVRKPTKTNFFCTPLYYAVRLNNIELVKKLLVKGASITDKDRNKETPLSFAMDSKSYKIVDLMLSMYDFQNMDLESKDETAHFFIACRRNKQMIIKKFVEHGMSINSCIDINSNNWPGFTPLHFAADNLWLDVVKLLLKHGADITAQDVNGLSPLHLAFFKEIKVKQRSGRKGKIYYYAKKLEFLESKLMSLEKESIIDRILISHTRKSPDSPNCPNPVDNRGISHFHFACARDTYVVELFLEYGVDVNKPVSLESEQLSGYTPLHIAVANQQFKTIILLLHNGAHVNAKTKNGLTPLHLAVQNGKIKIIELLLENGADVNVKNDKGSTPLHYAFCAAFHNNDIINLLLQHSFRSVNATDSRGLSHFHIACALNDVSIVQSFLDNGVSVNSYIECDQKRWSGFTALYFAIHYNQSSIVKLLLQNNATINSEKYHLTALHLACLQYHGKFYNLIQKYEQELAQNKTYKALNWTDNRESQITIISLLLQYKADVNARNQRGRTPLMQAYMSDINYVLVEVDKCLNPKKEHYDFLNDVKEELLGRKKVIIDLLLRHNADFRVGDSNNRTLLHFVCNNIENLDLEAEQMVELFLIMGADINAMDDKGLTPLHLAVENRERKIVESLLKCGADVNRGEICGRTALHVATNDRDGTYDLVLIRQLVAGGADPRARDVDGRTVLHNAAQLESCDRTAELFECLLHETDECDINVQDDRGLTPLYLACIKSNGPAIRELLHHGADVNLEDHSGKTILTFFDRINNKIQREVREAFSNFELIQHHVTKLIAAGFHVSEKLMSYKWMLGDVYYKLNRRMFSDVYFKRIKELDKLQVKCTEELQRMRTVNVDGYSSLYDVLYKDRQEMAKHAKNERFVEILEADGFEREFPLYGYLLKLQYRRGERRSLLLVPAKESLEFLRGLMWPDSCSEQVFKYLGDRDLRTLIEAKETATGCRKRKVKCRTEEDCYFSWNKVKKTR